MLAGVGRRRLVTTAGLVALAGATGVAGWRWLPRSAATSSAARPAGAVGTADVVRVDLVRREQVPGTMGYAGDWPISYPGPAGVLTWTAPPASTVQRGQRLYEVDG